MDTEVKLTLNSDEFEDKSLGKGAAFQDYDGYPNPWTLSAPTSGWPSAIISTMIGGRDAWITQSNSKFCLTG